jgi:RNA polymerase-binding protein
VTFAATASIPEFWTCRCGQPAGLDKGNPPEPEQFASLRFPAEQKSHQAYVRERRSQADGEALIEWALDRLHARRERQRRDQARQMIKIKTDISIDGPVAMGTTLPAAPEVALASHVVRLPRLQPRRLSRTQRRQRRSVRSQMGHLVGRPAQDGPARL